MSGYASPRFDSAAPRPADRVYVLASTYRSGSTHLSNLLWETGCLGAPSEYLNYENEMEVMKARLGVATMDDYLARLMPLRTSPNGVFGIKCHFHHFEAAERDSEEVQRWKAAAQFVYLDRRDRIGQAVSMARALQSNAWMSFHAPRRAPLFYSFDLIGACLDEIRFQSEGWWRWFQANGVRPFVVFYEELCERPTEVAAKVIAHLGGTPSLDRVTIPHVEKQSDGVNQQWIAQFAEDLRLRTEAEGDS